MTILQLFMVAFICVMVKGKTMVAEMRRDKSEASFVTLNLPQPELIAGCKVGLTANDIFSKCFQATYKLIRRGLPDDTATAHLRNTVHDLAMFAINSGADSYSKPLGKVCIPPEKYGTTFTVRWTAVVTESSLDDMLMTISNSFYHVTKDPTKLPKLSRKQYREQIKYWNQFEKELKKPIVDIDYSKIMLPPTARHAFDEKEEQACTEWHKYSGSKQKTPADEGISNVLYMAVSLMRAGCDPNGAWQLVRHYTALVFLGIRCDHVERHDLKVPNYFTNAYYVAARRLMVKAQSLGHLRSTHRISKTAFKRVYKDEIERYSGIGAWGQVDSYFGPGLTMKNMLSYTANAANSQLDFAELVLGGDDNMPTTSRFDAEPNCGSSMNSNVGCDTGAKMCYKAATWRVKSKNENCCNTLLCQNLVTVIGAFSSFEQCCRKCNAFTCPCDISTETALNVPSQYKNTDSVVHLFI